MMRHMKNKTGFFTIILSLAFLFAVNVYSMERKYVDGEVLIKYKETVTGTLKKKLEEKHALKTIREFKHLKIHHMKLLKGADVKELIKKLKQEKHVKYAEPNYLRKPLAIPNDPSWSQQWNMEKIGMPDAWDISRGSREVIVAVLDTGVDYNHPDLSQNMWVNRYDYPNNGIDEDGNTINGNVYTDDYHGWDFSNNNNDPNDTDGHGTHIAGIIGALANNNRGVAGINWNVRVMPLKFMESTGDVASEIKAIYYAVRMGAKIINASYGDKEYSSAEYDAVKYAGDNGVLFVAAAGNSAGDNDGPSKMYPASYDLPNIISVTASDASDNLASFSNYGATSVDLAAPGSGICSTYKSSDYKTESGTSVAAPHVSGVAALLWAERPDATFAEIKNAILQSVDVVPALSGKVSSGGRLNAYEALRRILKTIQLQEGWNFIAFPKLPSDTNVAIVLNDISSNVRIVWGYDNNTKTWLKWKPSTLCPSPSALCSVEGGKGYWVYMNASGSIDLSSWTTQSKTVSLTEGWNLIGYNGTDDTGVTTALNSINGKWTIIWNWTDGQWYAKHASSLNNITTQPLNSLYQGKAYWILMKEEANWSQ